jgi:membrane protein required for colicin V production
MNWLDILLGLILFSMAFAGFRRGFARAIVGFVFTIAALVLALWFYGTAGNAVADFVSHRSVANFIGFTMVFAGVSIAGAFLGWLASRMIKSAGLGWLDSILGGGLGLLRGTIVSIGIILGLSAFTRNPPPAAVAQSQIAPYVMGAANALSYLAPKDFRDSFEKTYDKVRKLWYDLKPTPA